MESFFRYIAYVDYYKDGEKIRNVGFLKWKLHNDIHNVEIQIKDVGNIRVDCDIRERNTGKKIGEMIIDKGIGSFVGKFLSMSEGSEMYIGVEDDRLFLCDIEGFIIQLDRNEYLSVDVKLKQNEGVLKAEKSMIEEDNKSREDEIIREKDIKLECAKDVKIKKKIKIIEPLHEDKWQQLCKEYPKVHPFPGKNTFLSVKPEDFIILQQEYQKLVHNSFLLHGFYNYGHMILGKLTEEKDAPVYIGIPGVYYEREKQAARMFGFVGFESTEQPVQSGSYGYYMIEVKI